MYLCRENNIILQDQIFSFLMEKLRCNLSCGVVYTGETDRSVASRTAKRISAVREPDPYSISVGQNNSIRSITAYCFKFPSIFWKPFEIFNLYVTNQLIFRIRCYHYYNRHFMLSSSSISTSTKPNPDRKTQ